jgi:GNAT superfamily N-acetyltransferase
MHSSCTVRPATQADVESMQRLLAQLFAIEQDFRIDRQLQASGLRLLLADPGQRCVLLANRGSDIVGMVTGQLVVSTAAGGLSLLVEDLVVDERSRRQGIGHGLVEALEAWGRRHGALRLQLVADETNAAALHFYESHSWQRSRMVALYKSLSRRPDKNNTQAPSWIGRPPGR